MNCKPGDIARITCKPNYNRLVSVDARCGCPLLSQNHSGVNWFCTALQPLNGQRGAVLAGDTVCIFDGWLSPLHDGDGTDEMVRIAGVPDEVVA